MTYQPSQEQAHGFIRENQIKTLVFELPSMEKQDTNTHDISHTENKFNSNESCSIKTTQSSVICCGDIIRIHDYIYEINSDRKITIIIIQQEQCGDTKRIVNIVEIPFTKEFHNYLFRPDLLHRDDLVCYDKYIREIPPGKKGQQEEKEIRDGWKNSMQEECELGITINPKVDSKKQRRVQCSFSLKNINIQKFIKKNSLVDFNKPNICRNIEIPLYISSKKRK